MLISVNTRSGVPVYRQIMDQVQDLISTRRVAPGDQMDSVRDLSKRLKVNPMTVSKAYAFLERDGWLERRRGLGLFVAARSEKAQKGAREQLLSSIAEDLVLKALQVGGEEDDLHRLVNHHWEVLSNRFKAKKEE